MAAIDDLLARARERLERLEPAAALAAQEHGALLVDIRSVAQRHADGQIPGALVIDRNVLEWRLDPSSAFRIPEADGTRRVVVVCQEGYQSSLVAATLQDLGLADATDLVGGFQAWRDAGLPVSPGD